MTIQQGLDEGRNFRNYPAGSSLRKMQEQVTYPTYNGQQAREILGISREMVRQLRKKFNLPLLLVDEDILVLKEELKKTQARREKYQQTRLKNQSIEANVSQ